MYHSKVITLCLLLLPFVALGQLNTTNFNCDILPPRLTQLKYITQLRPSDVKVVMAMGDSFIAGFGIMGAANESRGHSFAMGGDPNVTTLPNLLRFFNPDVVGYSVGSYAAEACYGVNCPTLRYYPDNDADNAAKAGSLVADMSSTQINYLIRQLNQNPNIDVQNDWKLLTIMIGANDVCASCMFNVSYLSPDEYQNNLMGTLERIRASLPRTFVNLVAGFNISQAYDLSRNTSRCANISRPLFIQCDCLYDPAAGAVRETIDASITQYNARMATVAAYYQRKAYTNFAVVYQPFATNTHISDLPSRFISRLDCFHPSRPGQEALAIALWNNMLSPAALKNTVLNMSDTPMCPRQDTLLYTY